MIATGEIAAHLDDLRTTLAQEMARWVGRLLKAARIAGRTEDELPLKASEAGPSSAKEPARRAPGEWSWLESRRKSVAAELNRSSEPGPIL